MFGAINHYFDKNFDDCIRNLITSVENFFRKKRLAGKRRFLFFRRNTFLSILRQNLPGSSIGPEVVRENLIFLYKVRNKIVHNDFRIKNTNGWGAKKGIGTVFYLYTMLSRDAQFARYVHSLSQQFLLLTHFCGEGNTLDRMKKMSEIPFDPKHVVSTPEDLDRFMFEGLRFSEREKSLFLQHGT